MKEDIVEYALTYGIRIAGKAFHISDFQVRKTLSEFIKDNSEPQFCMCQLAHREGIAIMCSMCNLSEEEKWGISITLRERLVKAGYFS